MGFAGGFAVAARAAHHARRRREHRLPRKLEDHRPPCPAPSGAGSPTRRSPPGIALGPAVGTLAGGLIVAHWGWRAMFFVFGLATLIWLLPWQQAVRALPTDGHHDEGAARPARRAADRKWPLWSMSIGHCARQLLLLFPARLAAAVPDQVARLHDPRNDPARHARLRGPGGLRARLRPFLRLVDALGTVRRPLCRRWMMVASQFARRRRDPRPRLRAQRRRASASCCASPGRRRRRCRSTSMPSRRCSPARAPRAPGSAFQNALGNLSGIFGPIVTGIIVDRAGYSAAFIVTAAVAAFGALWWAVGVPRIEPVELD